MAPREKRTGRAGASTTQWVYDDKLRRSRREGTRVSKTPRWGGLARRNPRDKLTLTITFRGGAECWYLVEARGQHGVVPGVVAIHDLMREIHNIHD